MNTKEDMHSFLIEKLEKIEVKIDDINAILLGSKSNKGILTEISLLKNFNKLLSWIFIIVFGTGIGYFIEKILKL